MNETTRGKTRAPETAFNALIVALRREHSDARLLELIESIKDKGVSTNAIVARVTTALGPRVAVRVQRLIANAHLVTRPRYKMTRTRRVKIWMRGMHDTLEDATQRVFSVFQRG
jgi:hypothetical protein